jgi:DNA modification methylase
VEEKSLTAGQMLTPAGQTLWRADHIEQVAIVALVLYDNIVRKHPKRQINKLVKLIKRAGFNAPIWIDNDNKVIAGEARIAAAKVLGMTHIPAIRIKHLTEPEARALRLADNRLGEMSSWDRTALALEFNVVFDHNVDMDLTGFDTGETDLIITSQLAKPNAVALDDCPTIAQPVSIIGDIWCCDLHRVGHGDARDADFIARLMKSDTAAQVFMDPPYNVPVNGHVCGAGKIKHEEFVMGSGEFSKTEFKQFLETILSRAAECAKDGGLLYVCMDWRSIHSLIDASEKAGLSYLNLCVWAKSNAGLGGLYRSQHELVAVFKKGVKPHRNNVQLGRFGRNRSNLWRYEGANSINPERRKELGMHPTVKPAALCADAILDCSNRGDIILDLFLGSGTVLVAAEDTGRVCYGAEIYGPYVDMAVRRWQEFTGRDAVLEETGQTFSEVTLRRASDESKFKSEKAP